MARRRVHVTVSGLVQMVGFRAFAQHQAALLGLSGSVRNTPSGEVEVEAEGDQEAVERLVQALGQGPRGAQVTDVSVRPLATTNRDDGFHIRF